MSLAVTRKFNGKSYQYRTLAFTKSKANEIVSTIRKAGKSARAVKVTGGYAIYAR